MLGGHFKWQYGIALHAVLNTTGDAIFVIVVDTCTCSQFRETFFSYLLLNATARSYDEKLDGVQNPYLTVIMIHEHNHLEWLRCADVECPDIYNTTPGVT